MQDKFQSNNVFLAKNVTPIYWASHSLLNAELTCIEELLQKGDWDYFMNLAGRDLPLISVDKMAKRLRKNNVKNIIRAMPANSSPMVEQRFMYRSEILKDSR